MSPPGVRLPATAMRAATHTTIAAKSPGSSTWKVMRVAWEEATSTPRRRSSWEASR